MATKRRPQLPPRLRSFKCRQVYHVYQRGSQRQRVFDSKAQLVHYLDRLDTLARRCQVRIHAFCLMSNHVHFMFEPLRKNAISRLMQHLQSHHARFMNGLRRTDGHLWRHHFQAKHIDSSAQYQATLLYIEQNPVKAGMCQKAHRYAFSSAVAHTANQPIYTLARHEREAQVRLYLDRWRKEFANFPGESGPGESNDVSPIDWPTWLRSPSDATQQQDLAEFTGQPIADIEGKPLNPPFKPASLPSAQARALSPQQAATLRYGPRHTPILRHAAGRGT